MRDEMRYLMQQPALSNLQQQRLLENVYKVTDTWVQGTDYRMEDPWRKVNFSILEQIRLPMHINEAPAPNDFN